MVDCFVTQTVWQTIFIIFVVRAKNAILVIPYDNVVRIEDTALKVEFYYACGMFKRNQR